MQQYRPYPQQQMPQRASHVTPRRGTGMAPMVPPGSHHQPPAMSQAQIAAQQQQASQLELRRKSRKPTDKILPDNIDQCIIGDTAARYRELREFERRLDATTTRKRLDIVDSVNRSVKRWKTLRIWVSNTVEDQVWQSSGLNMDSFDFTSNTEPTYRVKIEGRLLDDEDDLENDESSDQTKPTDADGDDKMEEDGDAKPKTGQAPKYRFSHFFKALTVDFPASRKGVDPALEWKKPERAGPSNNLPAAADFDEFTFKRGGDENMNIVINLFRHEDPERYALTAEMEDIVDKPEATRQELVMAIWDYIKFHGLQEDEDKRNFRCDDLLRRAFRSDVAQIPLLHTLITPLLSPLPPVKVPYTIRVDEDFHKDAQPTVYDIRVAVDDPLREKMASFLNNSYYAGMLKEVATLDEQLALVVQALEVSKAKHGFLEATAQDPTGLVKQWLSSQTRDLDVIMGEAVRGAKGDATGDEWRKGGKDGVWGSVNAKESVSVLLSKQPAPGPR